MTKRQDNELRNALVVLLLAALPFIVLAILNVL